MASRASTVERDDDALFVENGAPIKFCFHRSVTQGRGQIARDVERHGGKIVRDERQANVLLVDEQEDLAFLRRRYYSSTERHRLTIYVESRGFVQSCIRSGTYVHVAPIKQGMPGRAPGGGGGRGRVPFTEEDRDHLAYYIATRCPMRDGRLGNSAYKDLERLGRSDDPSWAWARRHTFHSWREHYKMNPVMMDARIDYYLDRLKDIGHHFGQDPRRHDHWELRQEEEEDADEEGEEHQQGIRRQGSERPERQQVRPAVVARQGRNSLAQREQNLVRLDEEEEVVQRAKRHRVHPDAHRRHDVREAQAKRSRVVEGYSREKRAPGVEAGHDKSTPTRESESDNEGSQEFEGSDLFGDRTYGDESSFEFDDPHKSDFPMRFSPSASPVPEPDGAPLSTQATLVASPPTARKEKGPVPAEVVEGHALSPESTVPPSTQATVVAGRERVVVQRARVRGASAQPGPSVPKEARTQGGVGAVEGPYRNTRARSRSVEPQSQSQSQPQPEPQPAPEPQRPRQRQDQAGKGKAGEKTLVPIGEDAQVDEDPGPEETHANASVVVTGGLATRETFEDEMIVEGLLEASFGSAVGEVMRSGGSLGAYDGDGDEDEGEDEDGDGEVMPELPPFQDIEIGSEPTDSDDAETHESLVRGAIREGSASGDGDDAVSEQDEDEDKALDVGEGSVGGGESKPHQVQDKNEEDSDADSDDADADRIERMAKGSLHALPAPAPAHLEPRVTRSKARKQTRAETSPPRTRSGRTRTLPPGFPSPGTKARAVVDRFQEEERRIPYEPPAGSRAAKEVRGRRRG